MAEYAGHDTDLHWDPAGGTAFVLIGQIRDLGGPGLQRNPIDSTHRDVTAYWRKFLKGFKDAGELTFDVALDGDLASHGTAALSGMLYDFNNDGVTLPKFRVTFPSGRIWTCSGMITGYEPSSPLDDLETADITVKLSGQPTFSGS